jgi:hypothetical protein
MASALDSRLNGSHLRYCPNPVSTVYSKGKRANPSEYRMNIQKIMTKF